MAGKRLFLFISLSKRSRRLLFFMLLIVRSYDDKTEHLSICPRLYRAVARSENPGGGLVVMGGDNVVPLGRDRVN